MSIKKRYKKMTFLAAILSSVAMIGAIASSCAAADSSNFKEVNASVIKGATETYNELAIAPNVSAKNLIYGTDAFNDGNYVLTIATLTDLNQYKFINGSDNPAAAGTTLWGGEWGRAVVQYNEMINANYPNGVKFLLYQDDQKPNDEGEQWNPYSKYPTPSDSSTATQEEKDNAGKYRREDESAKIYRQIVDLIQTTYGSSVSNWINKTSGTTNVMVIAFKNNNGKITPNFYNGGSSSSGDTGSGDGSSDSPSPTTSSKIINHEVTVSTAFSDWLSGVYNTKS